MVFDAKEIEQIIDKPIFPEGLKGGADTLLCDCPWPTAQLGNYGAIKHYPLMTMQQIEQLPLEKLCAEKAHLYWWATNATMEDSFRIIRSHGFIPRSIFTWAKPKLGLGQYFRGATEHCIFATRGKAPVMCKNQMNWGFFPVQDHSHKPEEFYDIIERMSPGTKRLELFARRRRSGWKSWGLECPEGSDVVIPGYPVPKYSDEVKPEIEKFLKESKGAKC